MIIFLEKKGYKEKEKKRDSVLTEIKKNEREKKERIENYLM